ncbi:helix-turn-helix transcriptional regulator [Ruegeria sp. PrR005]|uniref:Helix-turn-helix transcriptional regulator n=1 Tax=Ruegeria sp. PrR005 TaxID=2706882 RepID=A0A6B2NSV3_9RHOB|nr:helix-turn-helix transcriptional regulator [Ruegeria sp. PrR005]NDW44945.1 helix-turn-helix transcriptional regulator [Ruegeria sp. PrR005]
MLLQGQDWAKLCRAYRHRRGLKQEAMAQDFNVDQSTVSRWERGTREPSLPAKQAILNEMLETGRAGPDQTMRLMLEQSGSAVAVWGRDHRLLGCSPRFEREALLEGDEGVEAGGSLFGRAHVIGHVLDRLDERGFFDGAVMLAVLRLNPFLQQRRVAVGGVIVVSMFPVRDAAGEIAVLAIHDHDVFGTPLERDTEVMISFAGSRDGHSQTVFSELPEG